MEEEHMYYIDSHGVIYKTLAEFVAAERGYR